MPYAKGKPIVCYRTDFRITGDTEGAPYNLMLSESATARLRGAVPDQAGRISLARAGADPQGAGGGRRILKPGRGLKNREERSDLMNVHLGALSELELDTFPRSH